MAEFYAHSLPGRAISGWEPLPDHLFAVAGAARDNAAPFGFAALAELAGWLHDIGKYSDAFQAYLSSAGEILRGPDHSTAGAVEAARCYRGVMGRILAFIIAGHHAGLADGIDLDDRLTKTLEPYAGWEAVVGRLPEATALLGPMGRRSPHEGFSLAFLIRMLFSCLVDADFIATERFYAEHEGCPVERDGFTPLPELRSRLDAVMADRAASIEPTPVNALRAKVRDHVRAKAELPPGLFTLTVPTGGGKTLTSLSFALDHALQHGLRRVVFVIPFSSIVDQSADVFRSVLGPAPGQPNHDDVLEHHATFDWEAAGRKSAEDGRGTRGIDRLRRAAENWAAPVVVTTAVQFFESLFAKSTSRCRKLHNRAKSVIVLDEAQTIPLRLLKPCMSALDELARNYGVTIVLCTATQPALRSQDGFKLGLDIPADRELAPDPQSLFTALKRVKVERRPEPVEDAVVAARFAEQAQMLCIVNTRAHAQELFARIKDLPGAVHLSTLMCPAHRRQVLNGARQRLKRGEPARIVSTSLIEAGVDIDLPEVWRAAAGAESITQAAGRCNREGELSGLGRVVVFEAAERKLAPEIDQAWQAAREVLRTSDEPFGLEGIRRYFGLLYWNKGEAALDDAKLDGRPYAILPAIAERARTAAFPFESIARAFHMIDSEMEPVVVPWSAGPDGDEAEAILRRLATMDRPLGPDLRKLQHYTVAIPKRARDEWLRLGVLREVSRALGAALLRFDGLEHHDPATGVRLGKLLERDAASNMF